MSRYYWFESPTVKYGIEKDEPEDDHEENRIESPSLASEDLINSASVLVSAWCILLLFSYFQGASSEIIELEDNGPATVDTPITFTIKNSYETVNPRFRYHIIFREFPELDATFNTSNREVVYDVIFPSPKANEGYHAVYLEVWDCYNDPSILIGRVLSSFYLLESLIGYVNVSQDIDRTITENLLISTGSPVLLSAEIKDLSGFFESANFTYKWIINGSPLEETHDKFTLYNFTQPQINNISVIVTAITTTLQKSGFFGISMQSKDPIRNLTVDGLTNVELFRDEILQLNIKIDGGTPPFLYCWEIINSTTSGKICKSTNEIFFSITRYFKEKGNKTLILSVENDVSSLTKNITILINEIEHGTYLSFILVAVCSIIIAIFIIIFGIVKHKRQLTIKVARFALQSIDKRLEKTFWGRVRDSFTQ